MNSWPWSGKNKGLNLEDDGEHVGGPHQVGVVRRLLDVPRRERVGALVDVLDEVAVQLLDGLNKLLFAEDREGRLDALVQEEVDGRLPELVDAVGVKAGVNADDDVGLLHPAPPDVPVQKKKPA